MNRREIIARIKSKFPIQFVGEDIERSIIQFSDKDYSNPKRRINFPITIEDIYGSGGHAIIFKIRDNSGENYALRLSDSITSRHQIQLQQTLSRYAMAPEVLYSGIVPNFKMSFTIIETISGTFADYINTVKFKPENLFEALKCLLDKKYLLGFIHGDMNLANVVILKDGSTLGFIDFDWSFFALKKELNFLDAIPLIGDMISSAFRSKRTLDLLNRIKKYYSTTFGIIIDIEKITHPRSGGYYYGKYDLSSYIVDKELDVILKIVKKTFPSLKLPRIVN